MFVGQEKRNGRLYIGDDNIDPLTIPSLSEVRRARMGSTPGIETRPSPSLAELVKLQVCLSISVFFI
jgi:hypothetical protein